MVPANGKGERGWFCVTGRCTHNSFCGSIRHAQVISANGALHAGIVSRGWELWGSWDSVSWVNPASQSSNSWAAQGLISKS